MQFQSLRVRNYRSIGTEQTVDLPNGLTIVGPNNSGKTNLLRAVELFFTGFDNAGGYRREADLTFGQSSAQTTLVGTFRANGNPRDEQVLDTYDRLLALYEPARVRGHDDIVLQLIFSSAGNPTYRLSSDTTSKLPRENQSAHSRLIRQLVDELHRGFSVHYVPSAKSGEAIFSDVISPLLKASVAAELADEVRALEAALGRISAELTEALQENGLPGLAVEFGVPDPLLGGFLSYFKFHVSDPEVTSIFDKGRGIQSLAMFACFAWIAEREKVAGKDSLWLVEEPESYLHPQLYDSARRLLERLESFGQVLKTTHALGLIPSDPFKILGCDQEVDGRTKTSGYDSVTEATRSLRDALGVRFSDYFGLTECNIFFEGESDVRLFEWALDRLGGAESFPHIARASKRAFGGTAGLQAFLMSNYEYIAPERAVVSVFDGDEAGTRAVRAVNGKLGNAGIQFVSNRDYVMVRSGRSVEGLFPDSYLIQAREREPAWFDRWIVDAAGALMEFHIRDQSKGAVENFLVKRAEAAPHVNEWSEHWLAAIAAIERALASTLTAQT